ncbi:MAG: hypothetical protein R3A45_05245 [Bdellovibrionota bacterium]
MASTNFSTKKEIARSQKNQMIIVVKEIKLRPTTDKHDMDVKIKSIEVS